MLATVLGAGQGRVQAPASWIRSGGCKGPSVGLCRSSWPAVEANSREQVESRESLVF